MSTWGAKQSLSSQDPCHEGLHLNIGEWASDGLASSRCGETHNAQEFPDCVCMHSHEYGVAWTLVVRQQKPPRPVVKQALPAGITRRTFRSARHENGTSRRGYVSLPAEATSSRPPTRTWTKATTSQEWKAEGNARKVRCLINYLPSSTSPNKWATGSETNPKRALVSKTCRICHIKILQNACAMDCMVVVE